jgi:hypothetical protein
MWGTYCGGTVGQQQISPLRACGAPVEMTFTGTWEYKRFGNS